MLPALEKRLGMVLQNTDVPLGIQFKSTGCRSSLRHWNALKWMPCPASYRCPLKEKQQCVIWGWGMDQTLLEWNGILASSQNSRCSLKLIMRWTSRQKSTQTHSHPVNTLAWAPESSFLKVTWPGPQQNTELHTFSFKSLNLKGMCPIEVLGESQTFVAETLGALCKPPWPVSFLHQLFALKNVIQILLGLFPTTSKGNTDRKGSLGRPKEKAGGDCGPQMVRHPHHQYLKLVSGDYLVSIW